MTPTTASEHFDLGVQHYENDQFEAAVSCFDAAIALEPDFYSAYHNRALSKCALGLHEAALADMDEVIRHHPDFAEAYADRGYILLQNNAPEAALEMLDTAVNMDPENASILLTRAMTRIRLRRIKTALTDFERAMEADPQRADIYLERAGLWTSLGDAEGAVQDYSKAIEFDPEQAAYYLDRGKAYTRIPGMHWSAATDFNCFLMLATPDEFRANCAELFEFYRKHPAPFLLKRVLEEYAHFDQLPAFLPVLDMTREQCRTIQLYLNWLELREWNTRDPEKYGHLLALVSFYMGDPAEAYRIYEGLLAEVDILAEPLSLMGLYYYMESVKLSGQPYSHILEVALEEIAAHEAALIAEKNRNKLYYAGLILFNNDRFAEAQAFFAELETFLPAAYFRILTMPAMGFEPDLIEAEIAKLRTEESLARLDEYLRDFGQRFLKTDTSDPLATFLDFAHYREIQFALKTVLPAEEMPELPQLWTVCQLPAAELRQLDWQVRRLHLKNSRRQLTAEFRNTRMDNTGHQDQDFLQAKEAFAAQLEQDEWAGNLHENLEDFQRSVALLPDFSRQLGVLICGNGLPDLNTQILLVDYFYHRGNLPLRDTFLLYFYLFHAQGPQVEEPGSRLGKKTMELIFDPLTNTGPEPVGVELKGFVQSAKDFWIAENKPGYTIPTYAVFAGRFSDASSAHL